MVGSCPSEAHSGGWEGLGEEGWEPTLCRTTSFIIICQESGNASTHLTNGDII
jgi:hypothetical protein